MNPRRHFLRQSFAAAAGLIAFDRVALAHGDARHAPAKAGPPVDAEQQAWGIAGDPNAARRTITIDMSDDMRFSPDHVRVRLGETIRFVSRNKGRVMHEFVIGTQAALAEHAELMTKFPDMEHDDPWLAHVAPGETGEVVWTFNRAGDFRFACLIPGHYEAGMVGRIDVTVG